MAFPQAKFAGEEKSAFDAWEKTKEGLAWLGGNLSVGRSLQTSGGGKRHFPQNVYAAQIIFFKK